ncbi:MAG: helix-turn-helix domain-containing protein [Acholeplasmataceae bacterium]|jgi:predicted nucleotidyltransferase|nr:helix-turn-helix domain-containing protein [Acholeplasmataceae bacterium]
MNLMIKEARAEYGLTQKDLSEITDIPLRTIENWESGKRTPSPWVEKMVYSYLKQYPKNQNGIVTETKGIYEVNQIKDALLPLTIKYDINKIILYGSYAKGKQEPLSDIDLVVDGNIKGIKFFGLLEDVNNALVKSVDLIHLSQIDHNSDIYKNVMNGIILYER